MESCVLVFTICIFLLRRHDVTGSENNFDTPANGFRSRTRRAVGSLSYLSGQVSGDIILGGLFSVHAKGDDSRCGSLNEQVGIHRLEAMLYAMDLVNNDSSLLANLTLGVDIRDDCETVNTGLEQSLNFLQGLLGNRDKICRVNPNSGPITAGVVGPSYSYLAIQIASLLRLFKMPQISYAATSSELSDKRRFDYFMRTVPPDSFQAKTIADIISTMNWSAVFAINSRGSYGEGGIASFKEVAESNGICIADTAQVESNMKMVDFEKILLRFLKQQSVRSVVLFCETDDVRLVLSAAKRLKLSRHFIWIASDFWGSKYKHISGLEDVANGAITIEIQTNVTHLQNFYKYFGSLRPESNTRNPWFKAYWENHWKCKLDNTSLSSYDKPCNKTHTEIDHYHYDGKVLFVVDAVLTFAHALTDIHTAVCGGEPGLCHAMRRVTRDSLLSYLYNVTFIGTTGKVQFENSGDSAGKYDILQYMNTSGSDGRYIRVGAWVEGDLDLNTKLIRRNYVSIHTKNTIESQCGQPCQPGLIRRMSTAKCCWSCEKCHEYSYMHDNYTCRECPEGQRPDPTYTMCEYLPIRYLEIAWKAVIIASAGLGIVVTLAIIGVFIKYRDSPLIMAAGREVSALLFTGILMCYGLALVLVVEPDTVMCATRRLSTGISFCLCYSSLLVKTNRIARIFSGSKSVSFVSPRSQLFITALIVTPELTITLLEFYFSPPQTEYHYTQEDVVLTCSTMMLVNILKLCYNVLLILLCTYYAFKTRKTPLNFNEAKFIGFCMYTTCVIWIAFLPLYYGTGGGYEALAVCFSSILSATTILVFIFVPKVYIVIYKPEKNVKINSRLRSRTDVGSTMDVGSVMDIGTTTDMDTDDDRVSAANRATPHSPTMSSMREISDNNNRIAEQTLEIPKITVR